MTSILDPTRSSLGLSQAKDGRTRTRTRAKDQTIRAATIRRLRMVRPGSGGHVVRESPPDGNGGVESDGIRATLAELTP